MIPEGSVVTIGSVPMRHDNRYWKDPQKFDPERFLNEKISKTPKAASTFFGFGIRGCPGKYTSLIILSWYIHLWNNVSLSTGSQFANNYIKIFLSTIVRNLQLYSSKKFNDIQYKYSIMVEMNDYSIGIEKIKYKKTT